MSTALQLAEKLATDEALTCYLAFQDWVREVKAVPLAAEISLWNRTELYAGTPDSIWLIKNRPAVIDIKSSKEIYPEYCLQTAASAASLMDMREEELGTASLKRVKDERQGGRFYQLPPPDPILVPSITNILGVCINKPGLMYWASDEAIGAACLELDGLGLGPDDRIGPTLYRALGNEYGFRRNGKITPPAFAKSEKAKDTGSEAHRLCEYWTKEQIKDPGRFQAEISEFRSSWATWGDFPDTYVARLAKDLKEAEPFEVCYRTGEQVAADVKAFYNCVRLFEWMQTMEKPR